jgi:hypothetical protein
MQVSREGGFRDIRENRIEKAPFAILTLALGWFASAMAAQPAWESFKIYDGKVHAVEAFMKNMPVGLGSGWPGTNIQR